MIFRDNHVGIYDLHPTLVFFIVISNNHCTSNFKSEIILNKKKNYLNLSLASPFSFILFLFFFLLLFSLFFLFPYCKVSIAFGFIRYAINYFIPLIANLNHHC